jgi:hypothetical protein
MSKSWVIISRDVVWNSGVAIWNLFHICSLQFEILHDPLVSSFRWDKFY